MTLVLFIGDMLIMAFMIAIVVWLSLRSTRAVLDAAARIPLEDEDRDG